MDLVVKALTLVLIGWAVRGVLALLHRPRQAKSQMVIWSKLMLVIGFLAAPYVSCWLYGDMWTEKRLGPRCLAWDYLFYWGATSLWVISTAASPMASKVLRSKIFGESNALILTTRLPGCEAPANPAPSALCGKTGGEIGGFCDRTRRVSRLCQKEVSNRP